MYLAREPKLGRSGILYTMEHRYFFVAFIFQKNKMLAYLTFISNSVRIALCYVVAIRSLVIVTDENVTFCVCEEDRNLRLDLFIASKLENKSRATIQRSIANGLAKVNEKYVNKNYRVKLNDTVNITILEEKPTEAFPQDIPINIAYEDRDMLIVNKNQGMVVHPAVGNYSGTLVNALLFRYGDSLSKINGGFRPGIVHRIDKDTSGLLLVAKNDFSHQFLAAQIRAHSLKREYEAVVYGNIKDDEGTIDKPIARDSINRIRRKVSYEENAKSAITHFKVISRYQDFTHIKLILETGRTHQIRVHMSHIGHPLAGDPVYGPKKKIKGLIGQCLHAKSIGFIHPRTREYMEFNSNLPEYFEKFLRRIGNKIC